MYTKVMFCAANEVSMQEHFNVFLFFCRHPFSSGLSCHFTDMTICGVVQCYCGHATLPSQRNRWWMGWSDPIILVSAVVLEKFYFWDLAVPTIIILFLLSGCEGCGSCVWSWKMKMEEFLYCNPTLDTDLFVWLQARNVDFLIPCLMHFSHHLVFMNERYFCCVSSLNSQCMPLTLCN